MSFDAFRGIAIIAVVAIHAIPWKLSRCEIYLSYRQMLNFAVPSFIFMSGYWMAKKTEGITGANCINFLRKRLLRVMIPFLFWSLVYFGYAVAKMHDINVAQMPLMFFTGTYTYHLYFVVVIAQLYILTVPLNFIDSRPYGFISILMLNMVGLLIIYHFCLSGYWHTYADFHKINSPFYEWIIFYYIGLKLGNVDDKRYIPRNIHVFIMHALLIAMVISMMEAIIISKFKHGEMSDSALKFSSFIYSTCIIFCFLVLRERLQTWPRFLVILGEYSFGIYLVHGIVLRGLVRVVHNVHVLYYFQPLYEFIVVSTTLLICYGVIAFSRKLFPRPIYSQILGF